MVPTARRPARSLGISSHCSSFFRAAPAVFRSRPSFVFRRPRYYDPQQQYRGGDSLVGGRSWGRRGRGGQSFRGGRASRLGLDNPIRWKCSQAGQSANHSRFACPLNQCFSVTVGVTSGAIAFFLGSDLDRRRGAEARYLGCAKAHTDAKPFFTVLKPSRACLVAHMHT